MFNMCGPSRLYCKVFLILGVFGVNVLCEQFIQSLSGTVGEGNYTYYSLKQEGSVSLIVDSVMGDADIYVSQTQQKPDYIIYDLQSATCGQDIVTVPMEYKRPVGIAIYGHVYHPVSKYVLTVIVDWDGSKGEHGSKFYGGEDEEHKESMVWVVFINIMKIIVEVLA